MSPSFSHFPINAFALQKWRKSPFQLQESKTRLISFPFFSWEQDNFRGEKQGRVFFFYSLNQTVTKIILIQK